MMTSCWRNPLKPQRTVAVTALHLVDTWPPTMTRLCCRVRKTLHWYLQAAVQQVKGLYATMFLVHLLECEWIHILTAYTKLRLSNRQRPPLPGSPLIAVICTHSCRPFLLAVSVTVWSTAVHETQLLHQYHPGTELSTWNCRLWVTDPIITSTSFQVLLSLRFHANPDYIDKSSIKWQFYIAPGLIEMHKVMFWWQHLLHLQFNTDLNEVGRAVCSVTLEFTSETGNIKTHETRHPIITHKL